MSLRTLIVTPVPDDPRAQAAGRIIRDTFRSSGNSIGQAHQIGTELRRSAQSMGVRASIQWAAGPWLSKMAKQMPLGLPPGTKVVINYEPHDHPMAKLWTHGHEPRYHADFIRLLIDTGKREYPHVDFSHWGSPHLWDTGLPPEDWVENNAGVVASGLFGSHAWFCPSINPGSIRAGVAGSTLVSIRLKVAMGIQHTSLIDPARPVVPSLFPVHGIHSVWAGGFMPDDDLRTVLATIISLRLDEMIYWRSVRNTGEAKATFKYLNERYLPALEQMTRIYG